MLTNPIKNLSSFYALALLIPIGVMAAFLMLSDGSSLSTLSTYLNDRSQYPNVISLLGFSFTESLWGLGILLFAFAPSLAALAVCAFKGRDALRSLVKRIRPVGPEGPAPNAKATYFCLFGVYLGVLGLYLLTSLVWGETSNFERSIANLQGPGFAILLWVVIAPFLDEGGLLEELGWRGFAQPLLLSITKSPIRAALVVGFLWWAWHLPREAPALLSGTGITQWVELQALFLALCIAESIICVLVVNQCAGSVLPAILVHGGSNVWSKAASMDIAALAGFDVRTAILIVAAVLIVWRFGHQLGKYPSD